MSIHRKINLRQSVLIDTYLTAMFWDTARPLKEVMFKEIPKNMRYGGFRNTCYDIREY